MCNPVLSTSHAKDYRQQTMKAMSSSSLLDVLALSLTSSTAVVSGGGDASCPSAPRSVEAACREVCGTAEAMYEACMDRLRNESRAAANGTSLLYARKVVEEAAFVCWLGIWDFKNSLDVNASIAGEERAAYGFCIESYTGIGAALEEVAGDLESGNCSDLGEHYRAVRAALLGMMLCTGRAAKLPSSPLLDDVTPDLNLFLVANYFGKLLGVK